MHRKYLRALVGSTEVDVPTGTWAANRFLYFNGLSIITLVAVQGPVSSTDNHIARWDGTAGDRIQDSLAAIDDAGNITTPGTINGITPGHWVRYEDPDGLPIEHEIAIYRDTAKLGYPVDVGFSNIFIDPATQAMTGVATLDGRDPLRWVDGPDPGTSINNRVAVWVGTSGREIAVSARNVSELLYNPNGAVFSGRIVVFNGTSGAATASSIWSPNDFVRGPNPNNTFTGGDGTTTTNAIALWTNADGRDIKNSVVTIDPSGNITTPGDMTPSTVGGIPVGVLVKSSGSSPHPNNVVTRWSSATGHPLKDSTVVLDDSGNFTSVTSINTIPGTKILSYNHTAAAPFVNEIAVFDTGSHPYQVSYRLVQIDASANITLVNTINGVAPSRWVQGPAAGVSTDNTFPVWDGTTGRLLKNGGASAVSVDPGTGLITTPVGVLVHSGTGPIHTDNALVRWDGTGAHTQDSLLICDDSGNVTGMGTLNTRVIANFTEASSTFPTVGRIMVVATAGTRRIQPTGLTVSDIVTGPGSSASGNLAEFDTTSGHSLQDSGIPTSQVVTNNLGGVDGNIAVFNGGGGTSIRDSGIKAVDVFYSRMWTTRGGFAGTAGFDIFPGSTVINLPNTVGTQSFVCWFPYTASVGSNIIVTVSWSGLNLGSGGGQRVVASTGLVGTAITSSGGAATLSTAAGSAPATGIVTIVGGFSALSTSPSITINVRSSSGTHTLGTGVLLFNQGTQA